MPLKLRKNFLAIWVLLGSTVMLTACGGGSGDSTASTTTGSTTSAASVSAGSNSATSNSAPTISGTPATSVTVGSNYSFTPTASDANGDTLSFSISGKPSWATFNTLTGALTGVASTVGTISNIVITVTDANGASASLAAFSINVSSSTTNTGTATLNWTAPTQNTDGSSLTDLAGYVIYYGTDASNLSNTIDINSASTVTYTIQGLASGNTYYFAISSVNSSGVQSVQSTVGSKTIS